MFCGACNDAQSLQCDASTCAKPSHHQQSATAPAPKVGNVYRIMFATAPGQFDFFVETEVIGVACGQQHTAFLVRRRPPPNGQSSTAADASKSVVA